MAAHDTIAAVFLALMFVGMLTIVSFLVFALPFYFLFVFFRRKQIHHAQYDALTTATSHVALTNAFTAIYGVLLPAISFLGIRSHSRILEWEFSGSVHTAWKMAFASVVMVWLGARLIDALLSGERPRFSGWADRIFALLGVVVCLCYHKSLLSAKWLTTPHFIEQLLFFLVPHVCMLGTTLVYSLALLEAAHSTEPIRRPRKAAWAIAALGVMTFLLPLVLANVRVSHSRAMRLIETNRDLIGEAAAAAELDPRLLAGVIYVAQTRDKPAIYGKAFDEWWVSILDENREGWITRILPDPKPGLLALRLDQHSKVLSTIQLSAEISEYALAGLGVEMAFPDMAGYDNSKRPARVKPPQALVDVILSNPAMDPVLDNMNEWIDQKIGDHARGSLPMQWDAYRAEMFMPTIRFTCGVSRPIWAGLNASSRNAHHNFNCFFIKDHVSSPMVTEFIDIFPDRTRVLRPQKGREVTYYVRTKDMMKVVGDTDASILLGAAMLKIAAMQAAHSPGQDQLEATIQQCPYAQARDFTRRLRKIMNSPEFARLFPS